MVEGGRLYAAGMGSIALHHANALTHSHSRSKRNCYVGITIFCNFSLAKVYGIHREAMNWLL